jgi:hypothetical protein
MFVCSLFVHNPNTHLYFTLKMLEKVAIKFNFAYYSSITLVMAEILSTLAVKVKPGVINIRGIPNQDSSNKRTRPVSMIINTLESSSKQRSVETVAENDKDEETTGSCVELVKTNKKMNCIWLMIFNLKEQIE